MITPQELRYGNKLLFLNEIVTFKSIVEFREDNTFWINFIEKITPQKSFHFKPIPLTEDIFNNIPYSEDIYLDEENIGFGFRIIENNINYNFLVKHYPYLHQVQNLYYYLKRKELLINL
jgi:hypothetical protein